MTKIALSQRDAGRVEQAVRWHERNKNKRDRYRPTNIPPPGKPTIYARIVQTLRRGDPTASPAVDAVTAYKIKPFNQAAYPAWNAGHGTYNMGDLVEWTDGFDYQAQVTHNSSDADPSNPAFWQLANPTAYIEGYAGTNLLEVLPVFLLGDIVPVVYLPDYDADGKAIAGTEQWYIRKTATRVEITINAGTPDVEVICSMAWNFDDDRAMAVYG